MKFDKLFATWILLFFEHDLAALVLPAFEGGKVKPNLRFKVCQLHQNGLFMSILNFEFEENRFSILLLIVFVGCTHNLSLPAHLQLHFQVTSDVALLHKSDYSVRKVIFELGLVNP